MQRSGTQSFDAFSKAKGFSSKHFISKKEQEDFKKMTVREIESEYLKSISSFDCVSDIPVQLFLKKIIEKNRGSKLLLVTREPKAWAKSVKNHQIKNEMLRNYTFLDQKTYSFFLGKEVFIKDLEATDYLDIYKNYLKYIKDLEQALSLDVVKLSLEDNLSVPMNKLFDNFSKTKFVDFPNVDYLKNTTKN
jgi:hypothetical protein